MIPSKALRTLPGILVVGLMCSCGKQEVTVAKSDLFDMARDGDIRGCEAVLNATPGLANIQDQNGSPPILVAAGNGHVEVVALLLKNGANPNATEKNLQTTPLHWACYKGHLKIVEILIQAGASINAPDKTGRSPYDMASDGEQTAIMQFLVTHGGKSTDPLSGKNIK
jgi:hypothetical protein